MNLTEILKDFYFIERGYLNGNHFVLKSRRPVLIDTAYISGFNETAKVISELGMNLKDIHLIVNTHCHCDHIGGNNAIQKISGCDIAMHKIGKYFIDKKDDWSTWWRYYNQEAEFFNCTTELGDNDVIEIGPHNFRVIHTPGHSADGIVLYNEKHKILLSSDILWENDIAVMTIRIEGNSALFHWLNSMEKLSSLDVKIVYPGHGKPFSEFNDALEKTKNHIIGYLNNPEKTGSALLKKIIIYTLMMKGKIKEEKFFNMIMGTYWYRETVDLYFNRDYNSVYDKFLKKLIKRGIVCLENGELYTTIKR